MWVYETFNAEPQPKCDQLHKRGMRYLIRQISVSQELNDKACLPTRLPKVCKERFVRLKAI